MSERIEKLAAALTANKLAAMAIVPGANLQYLAGLDMHRSERLTVALFPANGQPAMVIPSLEQPRAQAQATVPITFYPWHDSDGPYDALRRCLEDLGLHGQRIGVEYALMRVLELRGMEQVAEIQAEDGSQIMASLRSVKDAEELAAMREAVKIIEEALQVAISQVRVGMTERELAAIWEQAIVDRGSSPTFPSIVASGPNSANPHHTNTDRKLQAGDLIVMDGGAFYNGYQSDITRTIALGEPSAEARRIYELVKAANAAGRAASRPGATGAEIDRAARAEIEAGGYGPQFLHRTGHGLGIEGHEAPYIVSTNHEPLSVGATFTIEPGIYVAGVGGVRIEDDVVITADGSESLTTFERELIVVPA